MMILSFPELRQAFEYDCGANALQSVFAYYGLDVSEETLIKKLRTTKRQGTKVENIEKTALAYGFKVDIKEIDVETLTKYLKIKVPVILLLQAWSGKKIDYKKSRENGHYVVAIGYDKNNFYFEDPYSIFRTYLSRSELKNRWHDKRGLKGASKNLAIAIYGKTPKFNHKKAIAML